MTPVHTMQIYFSSIVCISKFFFLLYLSSYWVVLFVSSLGYFIIRSQFSYVRNYYYSRFVNPCAGFHSNKLVPFLHISCLVILLLYWHSVFGFLLLFRYLRNQTVRWRNVDFHNLFTACFDNFQCFCSEMTVWLLIPCWICRTNFINRLQFLLLE